MVVCKFWQRGDCRNGDTCRFEHPGAPNGNSRGPFASQSQPRSNFGIRGQSFAQHDSRSAPDRSENEYRVTAGEIERDLMEPPVWILSCYGPGKDAPKQLFGGEGRELSVEEARNRYYMMASQGRVQEAKMLEDGMIREAEQQIRNARNDVQGAVQYIVEGSQQRPNRIDICRAGPLITNNNTFHQQQQQRPQEQSSNNRQASPFNRPGFSANPFDQAGPFRVHPGSSPFNRLSHPVLTTSEPGVMPINHKSQNDPVQTQTGTPWNAFGVGSRTNELSPVSQSHFGSRNSVGAYESTQPTRTRGSDGRLEIFNGQPVVYEAGDPSTPYLRRPDGRLQVIWFPDGKVFSKPEDLPLERYDRELEEAYRTAKQNGTFEGGKIPELPPKREWMSFNF